MTKLAEILQCDKRHTETFCCVSVDLFLFLDPMMLLPDVIKIFFHFETDLRYMV